MHAAGDASTFAVGSSGSRELVGSCVADCAVKGLPLLGRATDCRSSPYELLLLLLLLLVVTVFCSCVLLLMKMLLLMRC
jgi:hypothetical protein